MALICKALFPSISTFETPPTGGAIVWSDSCAPAHWPLIARLTIQMTARGGWYAPWHSRCTAPGRSGGGRPRLPASRAARLGKSSAVACAYLDAVAMESCKAHATCLPTPDDPRSSLQRKAHGPRGSVEGRPRVNVAVLIGCQMSADEHAQRRLTARIVTTSRDGTVTKHSWAVRRLVEGGKRREKSVF